jgi:hypothetical protein
MARDDLSEKEAALIAAARRGLDPRASPRPDIAPAQAIVPEIAPAAPEAPPAVRPDAAARIAALMSVEQEERQRRRKKLRQFGIVIPALVLVTAILLVASAILRYIRL